MLYMDVNQGMQQREWFATGVQNDNPADTSALVIQLAMVIRRESKRSNVCSSNNHGGVPKSKPTRNEI